MSKKRLTSLILFLAAMIGLFLLLYPMVANLWNTRHSSQMITAYNQQMDQMDEVSYQSYWDEADAYNKALDEMRGNVLTEEMQKRYESVLDVSGLGVMGYIEIPKIGVSLPIYHGTSAEVLQIGVGHVEWSSLPIGGEGTHCVLSGHRGLASAKLFSDLPMMEEGDVFYIRVLNDLLTYQVDQITTVKPQELENLKRVEGMDYCSLVTCTPYGINSHRLIVRGHRISNIISKQTVTITSEAVRIDPMMVAGIEFSAFVVVMIVSVYIETGIKKIGRKKG